MRLKVVLSEKDDEAYLVKLISVKDTNSIIEMYKIALDLEKKNNMHGDSIKKINRFVQMYSPGIVVLDTMPYFIGEQYDAEVLVK